VDAIPAVRRKVSGVKEVRYEVGIGSDWLLVIRTVRRKKGGEMFHHNDIERISYSKGKEVAEKLPSDWGTSGVSRDVLIEHPMSFNIPEIKLVRAIHDSPSVSRSFHSREKKNMSPYIRAAVLKRV